MFFLILFVVILSLLSHNLTPAIADMAEYLNNPIRVLSHQLPYRDFWLIFPPGEVYYPAFLYKIFGININAVLLTNVIIGILITYICYQIIYFFTQKQFLSQLFCLLIFINAPYNLYALFSLISLLLFLKIKGGKLRFFFSGLFLGLACYFRLYEVAGVFISFLLAFTFTQKRQSIFLFVTGFSLPLLILAFIFRNILNVLIYQLVIQSLLHGNLWHLPYFADLISSVGFLGEHLHRSSSSLSFYLFKLVKLFIDIFKLTGLYLLPIFIFFITLTNVGKIKHSKLFVPITLLFFWSLILSVRAFGRGDLGHLSHSLLPIFILTPILLTRISIPYKSVLNIIVVLASFSILSFIFVQTFNLLKPSYLLKTPQGTLLLSNQDDQITFNQLITKIHQYSLTNDYIFVTDWGLPPLYTLTLRQNPTYYDSLIDLLALPSIKKEQLICDALITHPVKLVIHDPNGGIVDHHQSFLFSNLAPVLNRCIEKNFSLREKIGRFGLYLPKQ